jgi:hypothetical protein
MFGCGDSGGDDDPTPMMPAGGSGGGGGAPTSTGEMLGTCETESATAPGVHDGYFKHETKGWEIAWFTYTDNAEAAAMGLAQSTITPMEKASFVCVQDADATRNYVFNAKGGPFALWGAGMGFNLQIQPEPTPPLTVDLTGYKGIRFWAKVGSASTGSVRVKMVDSQTTPVAQGGTCMTGCSNNFGFILTTISLDWQQFTVNFDQMTQESWSSMKFDAPEITKVIGFQFQVGKTTFDYSVDDFELIQ